MIIVIVIVIVIIIVIMITIMIVMTIIIVMMNMIVMMTMITTMTSRYRHRPTFGFNEKGLSNLQGSLETTIESAIDSKELHSAKQVRILLMVWRYVIAYTNHSLAMLAAIDWCAVREDGSAIYREIFYAPTSWNVLGPTPRNEQDAITRSLDLYRA